MPVKVTERYIHFPIRESQEFISGSLRTHDIGKKGSSKRIAGKLQSTGKWTTQKYLIDRDEPLAVKRKFVEKGIHEMRRLNRIQSKIKIKELM
jgi:hypothetical protein